MNLDRTKLLAARFRAANDRPYLAAALYALSVVPSVAVPTMAVDKRWRCYVSAEFVAETPVDELAAVWIHEVSHLLRDHPGRADRLSGPPPDRLRLNIAMDCEINDDLLADGLSLPAGAMHPGRFGMPEGRLFEEYLALLPPGVSDARCRCGSGATGLPEPWDVPGGVGVDPAEAGAMRRYTANAIRAHARMGRGSVPSGWARWAEQVLEPTVDWRQVLAGAVREAVVWASGAVDYTYARPSRRAVALRSRRTVAQPAGALGSGGAEALGSGGAGAPGSGGARAPRGVVLPSLRRPLPRVAIVVDTSGSMGEAELAAALGEVTGVLRGVGVGPNRTAVLSCDADVHAVRRVTSADQVVLEGGGGTDMRVGIDAALAVADPPQIVVVLTDGYTPWPDEAPRCRVVIGLIGGHPVATPSWAETVRIPVGP